MASLPRETRPLPWPAPRVARRQHISRPTALFPAGTRRRDPCPRHKRGAFHELVLVDVTGTVRVNALGVHPYHKLGRRISGEERIIMPKLRGPIDPHAPLSLEVDEEETNAPRRLHVAHGEIHAVSVVVRKRERPVIDDRHEARVPALVRAGGLSQGI